MLCRWSCSDVWGLFPRSRFHRPSHSVVFERSCLLSQDKHPLHSVRGGFGSYEQTSYADHLFDRFCRALGTLTGWIGSTGLLWWYWPEAHGFFVNPMSIFLMTTCLACDTAYPFILAGVRRSEQILSDGRLVSGIPVKKSAAPITKKRL